jgi:hypothetical protein
LTFPHNRIPRDWRLTKLWTCDPSVLPPEHRKEYLPPPLARPPRTPAATNAAQPGSGATHASDRPPSHADTVAHMYSNTCILNKEDELHPLNQTAFTMLLQDVTEHGSSELEARFDDLMYGLNPDRVAVFRHRLEERRTLLREHPNTAAQYASSTPVASQPSVPTPTTKAADDLADQLQSVRITGGATSSTQPNAPTPTSTPTPTPAPANRVIVPPLRLNTVATHVPMTQPTSHTHTPQSQTPLEQQVADLQQQVQQLMTLATSLQCRATITTLRYCSHTYIKQASKWMEPSTCTNCVERTKERPDSNALNQVCKTAQNYENMITWTHDIVILLPSRLTGDTSNWLQAHCQDKSTTSNHVQSKQTRNKRKISLPVQWKVQGRFHLSPNNLK